MNKERVELLLEDLNRKLDLLLEMQEALRKEIREIRDESNAKHDHTAFLIQTLSHKVDAVDAKVSQPSDHAATEAHHGMYRVNETPEEFG